MLCETENMCAVKIQSQYREEMYLNGENSDCKEPTYFTLSPVNTTIF